MVRRSDVQERLPKVHIPADVLITVGATLFKVMERGVGGLAPEANAAVGVFLLGAALYRGILRTRMSESIPGKVGNVFLGMLEGVAVIYFVNPQAIEGLIGGIQTYIHSLPDTTAQKPELQQAIQTVTEQVATMTSTLTQTPVPTVTSTPLPTLTPTITSTPFPTLDVGAGRVVATEVISQVKDTISDYNIYVEFGKFILELLALVGGAFFAKRIGVIGKSRDFLLRLGKGKEVAVVPNVAEDVLRKTFTGD